MFCWQWIETNLVPKISSKWAYEPNSEDVLGEIKMGEKQELEELYKDFKKAVMDLAKVYTVKTGFVDIKDVFP